MITVAPQVHRDRPRRFDGPDTTNAYQITTTQKCLFCKELTFAGPVPLETFEMFHSRRKRLDQRKKFE